MRTLNVSVIARASRQRIEWRSPNDVKVWVCAAPERGKANKAVLKLIASQLGVRPSNAYIKRGHTSSKKLIVIEGKA